jgi:hypothetical protein
MTNKNFQCCFDSVEVSSSLFEHFNDFNLAKIEVVKKIKALDMKLKITIMSGWAVVYRNLVMLKKYKVAKR